MEICFTFLKFYQKKKKKGSRIWSVQWDEDIIIKKNIELIFFLALNLFTYSIVPNVGVYLQSCVPWCWFVWSSSGFAEECYEFASFLTRSVLVCHQNIIIWKAVPHCLIYSTLWQKINELSKWILKFLCFKSFSLVPLPSQTYLIVKKVLWFLSLDIWHLTCIQELRPQSGHSDRDDNLCLIDNTWKDGTLAYDT